MSEHAAPVIKPADDPAFKLPASLAALQKPLLFGGIAALLGGMVLGMIVCYRTPEMPRFGMSAYLDRVPVRA